MRPRAHNTCQSNRSQLKLWASYDNYCVFTFFSCFLVHFSTISFKLDNLSTRRPQSHIDIYHFFYEIIFFLDDTGIRTYEKTLRLIVHTGAILHQVCTYHQVLRCWITMHAQLRSVRLLYIPAAQRSAVRSRAVRCRVPFAAVPCRAALCAFFRT